MTPEENKLIVTALIEAINQQDWRRFDEFANWIVVESRLR